MAYTPIITPADLTTHIYPEILAEITRNNTGISINAIDLAIQEAKMYLTRYDITALFGDAAADVAATFPADSFLLSIIKVIAVWNIISLANPNMLYDQWKNKYEEVLNSLKQIQKGVADPRWPYQDTTGVTTPPSIQVIISTNPKNTNSY